MNCTQTLDTVVIQGRDAA